MTQVQRQVGKAKRKGVIIPEMHKASDRRRSQYKIIELLAALAKQRKSGNQQSDRQSKHGYVGGRKILCGAEPAAEQIEKRAAVRRENQIKRPESQSLQYIFFGKIEIPVAYPVCQLNKPHRKSQNALHRKLHLAETEGGQTDRSEKSVDILTKQRHVDKINYWDGIGDNAFHAAELKPRRQNERKNAHLRKSSEHDKGKIQSFAENTYQRLCIVKDVGHSQTQRKARGENQRKYLCRNAPALVG